MEVRLLYNPNFGHLISTWYRGNLEGLCIEYDQDGGEIVTISWVAIKETESRLELSYHYNLTAPGSIQEEKTRLQNFFSEMNLFGKRLWYIQSLARTAINVAWKEDYFEHLNEEIVEDLLKVFDDVTFESMFRQQLIVYGILELGLTFSVMETLVESVIPPVIVCLDPSQQ